VADASEIDMLKAQAQAELNRLEADFSGKVFVEVMI
jgi:hypothetical protein